MVYCHNVVGRLGSFSGEDQTSDSRNRAVNLLTERRDDRQYASPHSSRIGLGAVLAPCVGAIWGLGALAADRSEFENTKIE